MMDIEARLIHFRTGRLTLRAAHIMNRYFIFICCLLPWGLQGNSNANELITEVDAVKAQQLADYNAVFLQEALYSTKRHRIVEVDTDLLLNASEFTITVFDDVPPFEYVAERFSTHEDMIYVKAHFVDASQGSSLTNLASLIDSSALIGMHAWDLYATNEAVLSMRNRRAFSPSWQIDGNETDGPLPSSQFTCDTRVEEYPQNAPEGGEGNDNDASLQKRQFYSVSTSIVSPDGIRYRLTPLRYTPKYSVIKELDPSKFTNILMDPTIGADGTVIDTRSEEDKAKQDAYRDFIDSLPDETGKVVLGDIQ